MPELPIDVARIINNAAPAGSLQFGGAHSAWSESTEWSQAPRERGLYMLGFRLGIGYERAVSRILYIGSTVNLRSRLRTYLTGSSHLIDLELLKHRYANGLLATWVALPGLSEEWLRAVEDAALQEALLQLGSYPALNRGRIDSPYVQRCSGSIRIVPCEGLPFPRHLYLLAEQLGSKTLGKLAEPRPAEYWKDKRRAPSRTQIVFTGAPQSDVPRAEQPQNKDPDVELLSWVMPEHLAVWDVGKMNVVIAICASLVERPKRTKTQVRTFEAPERQTPQPHTWGEVALVQGRIVAGTWLPSDRLWIKIVHEKELLGQAIFDKGLFDGWDKSDLPQTLERPSISERASWCDEVNAIEGQLPADFIPPRDETRGIDASEFPEHVKLMAASHAMDAEWEKFRAIDQDKWRRVREATRERIEAMYLEATNHPPRSE